MRAQLGRRIGLEISNSAVRVAEVAVGGGHPRLLNLGQVRLPARSVVDGVVNDITAVTSAIERCMKEGGFTAKEVHLGVAGLRAIIRELDMPLVPDGELDSAVRLQALDVIPFPIDRTLLSARPLEQVTTSDGTSMRRVLVAAAHRDLVEPLLEAVERAGLVALTVDLSSTALVRALYDPSSMLDGPEAIVSIGSGLTTIVVHEGGVPHFVRTLAEGGDTITAAIAGALDLPLDDAESTKRNLDQTGPHIRAAAAAAQNAAAALISEIRSSVEYYSALPGRSEVRRVVLTGGGSRLSGFADRLQQQTRAEVATGSVLSLVDASSLNLSPEDVARRDPLVATVVGLALPDRAGTKLLDLLPPEVVTARKQKRMEQRIKWAAAAVVVLLLGLGVLRFLQVHGAENSVASQKVTIDGLNVAISQKDAAAKDFADIKSDESSVSPVLSQDVNWPSILSDLGRTTPRGGDVTAVSGAYTPPVAPAAPSTSSSSSSSSSATTPTTVPPPSSSAAAKAQEETIVIATLSVSVSSNNGFSYFRNWMRVFENSPQFRVVSTSGVSHPHGSTITFTAQLNVLGTIQSSRISKFEVTPK